VRDADGVRINPTGLTDAGRAMARTLISHHVWLDLSHASDASSAELIALAHTAGQPILYTHTVLRRFLRAERGITAEELQAVRETHGLVGVMPSEDMLAGTMSAASGTEGFAAFLAQAREIGLVVGKDGVVLGTDYNGGVRHLPPAHGTGSSLDEEQGFWMIGQSEQLWRQLQSPADAAVERFLAGWERVFAAKIP
jgi:membrane dipeptidase